MDSFISCFSPVYFKNFVAKLKAYIKIDRKLMDSPTISILLCLVSLLKNIYEFKYVQGKDVAYIKFLFGKPI